MKKKGIEQNIIDALGLQNIPEADKERLLAKMFGVIQGRINDRVLSALDGNARKAFDALIETKPDETTIDAFLSNHVPNFNQIAVEETALFKQEMVENADALRALVRSS